MKLGSWLGLALSAAVAVPAVGCLGAPFDTGTGGAGTGGSTTTSSSSGGGDSCVPPTQSCNDNCVDRKTDANNCGACGHVCQGGTVCQDGSCVCPTSLPDDCGGACVNEQTDATNCGSCGHVCPDGGGCNAGTCGECNGTKCGEVCVDTDTDKNHCGSCANACAGTASCDGGQCTCDGGLTYCAGQGCFDTEKDSQHCGSSCTQCAGGKTCMSGACVCPQGQIDCNGACMPRDADNCCGAKCAAGQACDMGTCKCPLPSAVCSGFCGNPQTNPLACGSSCTQCGSGAACVQGDCACQDPLTFCDGVGCVDTNNDGKNCGACGKACDPTVERCIGGQCKLTVICGIGQVDCNGACVNQQAFMTDPRHCGGCNHPACGSGQVCQGGTCHDFFLPPACASCPCPQSCGSQHTCCQVGGQPVCISGSVNCP